MGVTMSDLSERLKELGSGLGGFCAGEALPKTGGVISGLPTEVSLRRWDGRCALKRAVSWE